ncbi:MAG: HDIG domain-containing protein [Pirellulales bacterium]
MLFILSGWEPPFAYREGFVPPRAVMARVAFEMPDQAKTAVLRNEKRRTVLCYYENQPRALVQLRDTVSGMIFPLRSVAAVEDLDASQRQALSLLLPGKDGELEFTEDQALLAVRSLLAQEEQLEKFRLVLHSVLEPFEETGVLKSLSHEPDAGDQRLLNVFSVGQKSDEAIAVPVARVRQAELSAQLPQQVIDRFQSEYKKPEAITVAKMVTTYLIPNLPVTLKYREDLSEQARRKAEESVPQATVSYLPAISTLAYAGKPLTAKSELPLLRAEHAAWLAQRSWMDSLLRATAFGGMIAALYLLCGIYIYYQIDHSLITDLKKLCSLLGLVLVTALLCRIISVDPWRAEIVPLVMCAITATIAYGRQIALLITTCIALAATLALGLDLGEFVTLGGGTCSAVLLLGRIRTRTKLIFVGAAAGAIVAMTHLGVDTLLGQINGSGGGAESLPTEVKVTTWRELLPVVAFESGRIGLFALLAAAFMTSLLPFVEWFFGVQTDSSLLELGDASHPLLRQLAQRAPGTYNHSINVAAIAEAAADAIGAHGLLTRVGAYFHDIGKIFKPNYFVENQGQGGNRHESLQPAMSTLVIIAHVKDGADLARQHKLPKPIIDFIEQHHGTTLVEYFFREATKRSQQDPHGEEVSETSYRYPGPKPQTLEAAVLMLADSVESASRSLVEPTSSRIQNLVDQMAMKKLLDGQFDECGLTLKQLDLIKSSLVKSLNAIYHGRIKYPGQQSA